jgi:hypothetical protein
MGDDIFLTDDMDGDSPPTFTIAKPEAGKAPSRPAPTQGQDQAQGSRQGREEAPTERTDQQETQGQTAGLQIPQTVEGGDRAFFGEMAQAAGNLGFDQRGLDGLAGWLREAAAIDPETAKPRLAILALPTPEGHEWSQEDRPYVESFLDFGHRNGLTDKEIGGLIEAYVDAVGNKEARDIRGLRSKDFEAYNRQKLGAKLAQIIEKKAARSERQSPSTRGDARRIAEIRQIMRSSYDTYKRQGLDQELARLLSKNADQYDASEGGD